MKTAVDVSMYNLAAFVHEASTGERYAKKIELDPTGPVGDSILQVGEEAPRVEEVDAEAGGGGGGGGGGDAAAPASGPITVDLPGVSVHFLPLANGVKDLATKSRYKGSFEVAVFGHSLSHTMTPELGAALAPNARIAVESAKFMLDIKAELQTEYLKKVSELAGGMGAVPESGNAIEDGHHWFHRAPPV